MHVFVAFTMLCFAGCQSDSAGPPARLKTYTVKWPNGRLKEEFTGCEKDGEVIKHGRYRSWYENGVKRLDSCYNNGKISGRHRYYHDNGNLWGDVQFKNGVQDGHECTWDRNGLPSLYAYYEDGVLNGPWTYFEFGSVAQIRIYDDGRIAELVIFTEAFGGRKVAQYKYRNGLLNGVARRWTVKGKLVTDGIYRDDKRWSGTFPGMMEKEDACAIVTYKDGQIISRKRADDGLWRLFQKTEPIDGRRCTVTPTDY